VQESATVDEPQHLTAGYTALRTGDHRLDPEHPPFLRMWSALPLLAMPSARLDTNTVAWRTGEDWEFSHYFLYQLNNADALLYRARFMTVILGIVLGVLLFSWAHELFGFWTAAAVLALYCGEPNILAHSSLVTTDIGVVCFIFGALYFLWRATRALTWGNAAGLIAFFALGADLEILALLLAAIVRLARRAYPNGRRVASFTAGGELYRVTAPRISRSARARRRRMRPAALPQVRAAFARQRK